LFPLALLSREAHSQNTPWCGAPPGASLYASPPCTSYKVPSPAMQARLLHENPQCARWSDSEVTCSRPVTANYGQVAENDQDRFTPRTQVRSSNSPVSFVVPAGPPPLGVPPQQRAAAAQLWQRAVQYFEQGQYRNAIPLLLKAAYLGDMRSQATLGGMLQNGEGFRQDDRAAAYWFSAAAAQGHRASEYALGSLYETGQGGLPQNEAKAIELYTKSASQGFDLAQEALGIAYELGTGVPRSRPKALELLRLSGQAGGDLLAMLQDPHIPQRFDNEAAMNRYFASWEAARRPQSVMRPYAARPIGWQSAMAFDKQWQRENGYHPAPPVPPQIPQY